MVDVGGGISWGSLDAPGLGWQVSCHVVGGRAHIGLSEPVLGLQSARPCPWRALRFPLCRLGTTAVPASWEPVRSLWGVLEAPSAIPTPLLPPDAQVPDVAQSQVTHVEHLGLWADTSSERLANPSVSPISQAQGPPVVVSQAEWSLCHPSSPLIMHRTLAVGLPPAALGQAQGQPCW